LNETMGVELQRRGAVGLLHDLEIPLSVVLAKMDLTGIGIDRQRLDNLLDGCTEEVANAQQSTFAAIGGQEVNLASPKQLQSVLFVIHDMAQSRISKLDDCTDADSIAYLLIKTEHTFLHNMMGYRDAT